jgi:5-formyltetrahydrofolate cyclo-ligase
MNKKNENQVNVREKVWSELRKVAYPDSRFHFDFDEFIPDFFGSDIATKRLVELDVYKNSNVLFITPDNCLEGLRCHALLDNKTVLMSTYGIRRGFLLLDPGDMPKGFEAFAVMLDAVEKFGKQISLNKIQEYFHIDLLVTGGSAVTRQGIRTGKGHGFFDIEWGIFTSLGVVNNSTPIVDIVHDCQIIEEDFDRNLFDTACDFIVTPTQVITIPDPKKPSDGIYWELLQPNMMETIMPLKELKYLEEKSLCKNLNNQFEIKK